MTRFTVHDPRLGLPLLQSDDQKNLPIWGAFQSNGHEKKKKYIPMGWDHAKETGSFIQN
jgi:hypothetical protein